MENMTTTEKNTPIMELVAGYNAYSDVSELNVSAVSDAPATSLVCTPPVLTAVGGC